VRDLARRAAFAVVAIPTATAIILYGGLPFVAVLMLIAGFGAWEYYRLAEATGIRPLAGIGIACAVLMPVIVHTNAIGVTAVPFAAGALAFIAIFTVALWTRLGQRPLAAVSATIFGALYTGGLLSFAYLIRYHRFVIDAKAGTALLGLPLVLTWATDTGGYIFGRAFGKKKLMEAVSPGKTIVGAFGGVGLATAAAFAYIAYVLRPLAHLTLTPAAVIVFGVVVSFAGQVGDLAESMIKREAGVKDSSNLIPGHGGFLDRFDSTLFIMPVAYVLLTEFARTVL